MANKLEELKKHTIVVADTGDFNAIEQYKPRDATTNPSLILKAAKDPQYKHLIDEAVSWAKENAASENLLDVVVHKIFINFGLEILKTVPGRVSTEVDARFSFDVEKSLKLARTYIKMYEEAGISRDRILIKLASTWEGIETCRVLQQEGIHCNMTLLFSLEQAIAAAEAKATLISPFVGRIFDFQKKAEGREDISAEEDQGVISVRSIYNYYKKHGYNTEIMGASFRNTGEILALAGCDLLTISPNLLEELEGASGTVEKKLSADRISADTVEKHHVDEQAFRWALNEDAMATEKLSEGIRNFAKDTVTLEKFLSENYSIESNKNTKAM